MLCLQDIAIDITNRNPLDNPAGIPYKLVAEACIPAIKVNDIGSVFEEHRIVRNLTLFQQTPITDGGGFYGEEENRFVFNNVLVGVKAKARFKISNVLKVPCDVLFSVKPAQAKHTTKQSEVFEVEPTRAQIASHSHVYVTVSFQPPSMQVGHTCVRHCQLPTSVHAGRSHMCTSLSASNLRPCS